tara:strand:- start:3637 stop:4200 length:564 start_codon:yes stop_codon:yes gene_type:complete
MAKKSKSLARTGNYATTREERDERREQILRLKMSGKSNRVIARTLNVSVGTVKNDLQVIRQNNGKRFTSEDVSEYLGISLKVFEEVEIHAWQEYHECAPGTAGRIKALDLIRNARKDGISLRQEVGMIQRAPEKREVEVTSTTTITQLDPQVRRALADALIDAHCTTALPAPEPNEIILIPDQPDEA